MNISNTTRGETEVVFTFICNFWGQMEEMDFYYLHFVGETKTNFATN